MIQQVKFRVIKFPKKQLLKQPLLTKNQKKIKQNCEEFLYIKEEFNAKDHSFSQKGLWPKPFQLPFQEFMVLTIVIRYPGMQWGTQKPIEIHN